jgi:hypothetical protein
MTLGDRMLNLMSITLGIIILGGIITALRRAARIVRVLKEGA